MALLYGRAGRLTVLFGGFRPGQCEMLRKAFICGLIIFVSPGSLLQIVVSHQSNQASTTTDMYSKCCTAADTEPLTRAGCATSPQVALLSCLGFAFAAAWYQPYLNGAANLFKVPP